MGSEEFKYIKLILDSIGADIKAIEHRQISQGEDIAGLKVKSGIWGVVGGALISIPAAVVVFIRSIT
jgi:hypothetical protein